MSDGNKRAYRLLDGSRVDLRFGQALSDRRIPWDGARPRPQKLGGFFAASFFLQEVCRLLQIFEGLPGYQDHAPEKNEGSSRIAGLQPYLRKREEICGNQVLLFELSRVHKLEHTAG